MIAPPNRDEMRDATGIESVRSPAAYRRCWCGAVVLGLVLAFTGCSTTVEDLQEMSDTTLCDIVSHRDENRRVRQAAEDELAQRGVECDKLAAVLRRRQMNELRNQLENEYDIINGGTGRTYSDCVLTPTCNETR